VYIISLLMYCFPEAIDTIRTGTRKVIQNDDVCPASKGRHAWDGNSLSRASGTRFEGPPSPKGAARLRRAQPTGQAVCREGRTGQAEMSLPRRPFDRSQDRSRKSARRSDGGGMKALKAAEENAYVGDRGVMRVLQPRDAV
jgi:hypothetical protein